MKYQPTGEYATPLTAAMLEALHGCYAIYPMPFNVRNIATAKALLSRGFIEVAVPTEQLTANCEYVATERGRRAYRITKRLSLGA